MTEQDLSTKRNAFQMLCTHAQPLAVKYLLSQLDNVAHWGGILQMAVLDLIRKVGCPGWQPHRLCVAKGPKLYNPVVTWKEECSPCCVNKRMSAQQVCRGNPSEKGKYMKIILALLQSNTTAVVYECAVTLVSLSQAPTAIRAAANCYCQLLVSQSDNNVKLIVLDRLQVDSIQCVSPTNLVMLQGLN